MKITGDRIKKLRQECGLTQEQFGELFGVSKHAISLYEANKNIPGDDVKVKIAKHFNISLDWLMGLSNVRNPVGNEVIEKNTELTEFLYKLQFRDDLKNLIREVKDLKPDEIEKIIQIIQVIK